MPLHFSNKVLVLKVGMRRDEEVYKEMFLRIKPYVQIIDKIKCTGGPCVRP